MQNNKPSFSFSLREDSDHLHQLMNYFQTLFEQIEKEFGCNIDQIRYPVLMLLDLIEKEDYIQQQVFMDNSDPNDPLSNREHKIQFWKRMRETCLQIILEKKTLIDFEMEQQIKQKERICNLLLGTSEEKLGSKILIGPTCIGVKHGHYYYKNKYGNHSIAGEMYLNYKLGYWMLEGKNIQLFRQYRKKFGVIFNMDNIQYVSDGVIIKNDRIDDSKDSSQILTNINQIRDLNWQGSYGLNGKKIGKWNISFQNQVLNAGGNYQQDGIKVGQWIDLYEDFAEYSNAYFKGQYKEGRKYGRWNTLRNNIIVGGGNYDEKALKDGHWIDIAENYQSLNYLSFKGEYKQGKKCGLWRAIKNNKEVLLGKYDENCLKTGKWMNFYKLFNQGCRVILFGQYNNGKKFGQWDIYLHKRKIGGGTYNDEGKKVGLWKEISLNFSQDFEVFYAGLYEQGIRQGDWSIIFQDRQMYCFDIFGKLSIYYTQNKHFYNSKNVLKLIAILVKQYRQILHNQWRRLV